MLIENLCATFCLLRIAMLAPSVIVSDIRSRNVRDLDLDLDLYNDLKLNVIMSVVRPYTTFNFLATTICHRLRGIHSRNAHDLNLDL